MPTSPMVRIIDLLSGRRQLLNKAVPYPQRLHFPIFHTVRVAFPTPLDYEAKMTMPFV